MNSPAHPQIQRTLAAIVITDAVGFSKRMSQDEDRALAIINRDLQLIGELCEFFEGQILKTVGDGVLMYFVSAVQAAACAIEMQKTFASFAKTGKQDEHFTHRVGVHLGDIFFNQQDMMGTGVNIAARLESEAKPGAVCMSQVVYDVVKSRLELDACYIGKLALKNIEEAVAAYHVWPLGMKPEENNGESTEAIAPLKMTPLSTALKALSEHANGRRIKKLLYGTHKAAWENSAAVLEAVPMRMLLESLTDRNPTLHDCRQSLFQIVRTLNRQDEYAQVAEVILESLAIFYAGPESGSLQNDNLQEGDLIGHEQGLEQGLGSGDFESSPLVSDNGTVSSGLLETPRNALYHDISERLDHISDPIRMRKMLYCLCYDSWENSNECIAKIKTFTLIETLYQQVTTIQGLQNRLRAILLRLNRKAKYAPIADVIFKECRVLYPEGNSQISMPGAVNIDDTSSDNTQINLRKKPAKRWISAKHAVTNSVAASVLARSAAFGN